MLMLFADMTFWDLCQANITLIAGGMSTAFLTISGAIAWIARVVWYNHNQRAETKNAKECKLLDTLTEHLPQQSETLRRLSDHGSDVVREVQAVKRNVNKVEDHLGDLAEAIVASACPEAREVTRAHVDRFKRRRKSERPETLPHERGDKDTEGDAR